MGDQTTGRGIFDPLADVLPAEVIALMHRACNRFNHNPETRHPDDSALTAGVRVLADYRLAAADTYEIRRLQWDCDEAKRRLTEHIEGARKLRDYNALVLARVTEVLDGAGRRKTVSADALRAAFRGEAAGG